MSAADVSNNLKQVIERIAIENGISTKDIQYGSGSKSGEGFTSNNTAVEINDGEKSMHLFCKTHVKVGWHASSPIDNMFVNEVYFYKTIYPAYQEFLNEKGAEDGFRNVPRCYAVENDHIVLENLKIKGFDLFEKGEFMNDDHILLTLKTLAKFHAVSFAFKDQKRDLYNEYVQNIRNCFTDLLVEMGFDKTLAADMRHFLRSLHPVEDKRLLEACGDLEGNLTEALLNVDKYTYYNPVVIQGDCWCNNMMYLYEEDSRETPVEVMVLDWQVIRNASPVLDLSYFFYSIASESALENLERYLKIYHDELSKSIKQLGSEPDILYPFSILKEEWKKFAKYSFGLDFFVIKALVADKEDLQKFDEFPDLRKTLEEAGEVDIENIMVKIKNEDVFFARMKMILKHFIEYDLL